MSASIARDLRATLIITLFLTAVCGVLYPLAMTGAAQAIFPHAAGGSMVERGGVLVGSELIGQQFAAPEYFHPRPSAAGDGYDASASSGSNLGPTSAALVERVEAELVRVRTENGLPPGAPVPVDAVTASASGLDPHISPAYARLQAPRVAAARGMSEAEVTEVIEDNTSGPPALGAASVNVLLLNLALDAAEAQP